MKHPDRTFSFKEIENEDDLVRAMREHTWPLCYGFYHERLLYLGDGDAEDAPEYAVVAIDSTEGHHGIIGHEVGRIIPSGMEEDDLRRIVADMKAGRYTMNNPVRISVEPKWHHSCQHCRPDELD